MANPTIKELNDASRFLPIAELDHPGIKTFVLDQLSKGGRLVTAFMLYQLLMLLLGIGTLTRALFLAFSGNSFPLLIIAGALVFSFSLLIIIHELLHGLALKLTGAQHVHYGGYFRRFIFYAEADRHVLNKKQFAFVALTPLVAVQLLTLLGVVVFWLSPAVYFMLIVMATHSFFCAGDIGLLTVFFRHKKVYTFDVADAKKSYYFREIDDALV